MMLFHIFKTPQNTLSTFIIKKVKLSSLTHIFSISVTEIKEHVCILPTHIYV